MDRASAATRAAFVAIDLEGVGPHEEARALLTRLSSMHEDDGANLDWKGFGAARKVFVAAASDCLKAMRGEK